MIVRSISEIEHTERDVNFAEGKSLRILLKKDGLGFSVHKTLIPAGNKGHWHYKNHLEACYCIQGRGILTDLSNGNLYEITPDTIYALNLNDDHTFEALTDVVLLSVFNPPVTGNEIHKEDGSYEADI